MELKPIFEKDDAKYEFIDNDGKTCLILTNHDAPMFKIIRVDIENASRQSSNDWETVIPEDSKRKLDWIVPVAGDKLLVAYLEDVKTRLYLYDRTGKLLQPIKFPIDIGSVSGISGRKKRTEVFFSFESFFVPTVVYRTDLAELKTDQDALKITELKRSQLKDCDVSDLDVKQVFYSSKDGTKVNQ